MPENQDSQQPPSVYDRSVLVHRQLRGKISVVGKLPVESSDDLSLVYTPGVAGPCELIAKDPSLAAELTIKRNTVAVVSDGSAVLGLGNIGPEAAIPVMEGKALLFREYGNIDAWPICLATQDPDEIVKVVQNIAPVFGGINLEDISAPRCFEIENRLQDLGIPVFHDDQHGTAIVLLAALLNASKVTGRKPSELKVVINGAGAAGTAIAKLIRCIGHDSASCEAVQDVIVCDSKGAIHNGRNDLADYKKEILKFTNRENKAGTMMDALRGSDVFIGVSKGGLLNAQDIQTMAKDPIVLAMANPIPEIMPDEAIAGGAVVVGTGRSDFPNQVNNLLAFPGIFRGALDARANRITQGMKIAAARSLADLVKDPTAAKILPNPLNRSVAPCVASAVKAAYEDDC